MCIYIYMCVFVHIYLFKCVYYYFCSDSSERLALINTSEEMGQARDTSTHVTFNALNPTSSPRILDRL